MEIRLGGGMWKGFVQMNVKKKKSEPTANNEGQNYWGLLWRILPVKKSLKETTTSATYAARELGRNTSSRIRGAQQLTTLSLYQGVVTILSQM